MTNISIPHANELNKHQVNNVSVSQKQKELVSSALKKRQQGQTQFTVELTEPLNNEVAKLLSDNGYSYYTSSSTIYQLGVGNKEKHVLTFGVFPLKRTVDWIDYDYWF